MVFVDGPPQASEPVEPVPVRVLMSERLERWISHLCRDKNGEPIALTVEQRQLLQVLYDGPPVALVVEGTLAPCLALAVICGPIMGDNRVRFATGNEEMWATASPELRAALERDEQGRILYGSRWPILTT
jgi:hypothetical protein